MGLSINEIDRVYDIAGIRINCQFVEDIYMVVELLKKRQDLEIVETRDYILHQRAKRLSIISYSCLLSFRNDRWNETCDG